MISTATFQGPFDPNAGETVRMQRNFTNGSRLAGCRAEDHAGIVVKARPGGNSDGLRQGREPGTAGG